MARKRKREINVFSLSAIDLFASAAGVFIILMMVVIPNYGKKQPVSVKPIAETEKIDPKELMETIELQTKQIEEITEEKEEIEEELKKIQEVAKNAVEELTKEKVIKKTVEKTVEEKKKTEEELEKIQKELKRIEYLAELKEKDYEKLKEEKQKLEERIKQEQEIKDHLTVQLNKQEDIEPIKREREELKKKVQQKQEEIENIKRQLASVQPKTNPDRRIQSLEQKNREIKKELEKTEQKLEETEEKLEKTEEEIKQIKYSWKSEGSFVAVVIRWSTEKHDIDLVVKDSKGKTFNFKKRSYSRHPGLFALDSRTGPGAELWQSAELIPGVYTVKYSFYNHYGNKKPAIIDGTIFSKEGTIPLPTVKLDFSKRTKAVFKFRVSENRKVTLLK